MTGADPIQTARAAWGDDLPQWVADLARECAASSQSAVARQLARSPALISNVLRAKYAGDLGAIERRFNGVFKNACVSCPAMGELPIHECQDWQVKARDFVSTNPTRVRMYRACGGCPIRKGGAK